MSMNTGRDAPELDVEGRGVLESEPGGECPFEDFQLEQCRRPQHGEGPLEGVGEEGDCPVLEDARPAPPDGLNAAASS